MNTHGIINDVWRAIGIAPVWLCGQPTLAIYNLTATISEILDVAITVGLMVGLYVLALRVLVAFIRPGGNVNRIMGLSVGGVMAIVAAQSYTRAYDGNNDLVSLGVLLGGLVLNIVILNKMYEVKS